MQCVTATDPHWLAEMGPVFFSIRLSIILKILYYSLLELCVNHIREGGQTRREKRKKEREEKQKMELEHKQKLEEAQR